MKKRMPKLRLTRETLRALDSGHLWKVAGATVEYCSGNTTCYSDLSNCLSNYPGMCDPSLNSECVSRCLACPDPGPSVYC